MKKALLVDDSSFMRKILKGILLDKKAFQEPIEIFEADGKVEALKILKKTIPDIILLDIVMLESETEGLDFIKEVKDIFNVNKIVIISSIGSKAILDECNYLGVKNYLQKPFDYSQVIEMVKKIIT